MKMTRTQLAVIVSACAVTILLRIRDVGLPIDSMIALALLCGAVLKTRSALLIPLGVRLATDMLLHARTGYGFYPSLLFDYSAYALIAGLAVLIPRTKYAQTMLYGGLLGPVAFFLISNFGVWLLWPDTYARTMAGLAFCYAKAIPFFGWSTAGNVAFSLVFLTAWHLASEATPAADLAGADTHRA